jgi:hypothetical protein
MKIIFCFFVLLVLIAFNVAMTSAALVCLLLLVFRKLGKRTRVKKTVFPSSVFTVEKVSSTRVKKTAFPSLVER